MVYISQDFVALFKILNKKWYRLNFINNELFFMTKTTTKSAEDGNDSSQKNRGPSVLEEFLNPKTTTRSAEDGNKSSTSASSSHYPNTPKMPTTLSFQKHGTERDFAHPTNTPLPPENQREGLPVGTLGEITVAVIAAAIICGRRRSRQPTQAPIDSSVPSATIGAPEAIGLQTTPQNEQKR